MADKTVTPIDDSTLQHMHTCCREAGRLTGLLDEIAKRLQPGQHAEALQLVKQARNAAGDLPQKILEGKASQGKPASAGELIYGRIYELRDDLFGAMAVVHVAHESVNPDHDFNLHRALHDAYKRMDAIASEMEEIALDSKRIEREVSHG